MARKRRRAKRPAPVPERSATLGSTGKAPQDPYAALALDGGPRSPDEQPRDLVVVLDRNGTILDLHPVLGDHSLREFDGKYPGLPIFGPLRVLASDVRDIIRAAARGPCLVEERR